MKASLLLMHMAVLVILAGCASFARTTKQDSAVDGTPPEFSGKLPSFQFDKDILGARSVGTIVFQVRKVGSLSANMDPGFLVVLANVVVLSSEFMDIKKGDVIVAEFPEMAAMLDQSILYPNQLEVGDIVTITVTEIKAGHVLGTWKEKRRANQPPLPTPAVVTPAPFAPQR